MSEVTAGAQPTTTATSGGDGSGDGGGVSENASPFAAVLDAVPQGQEAVEAALKKVEGSVTQRFQEAADFRKQWEPFSELGLADMPVEKVGQALTLSQLLEDPTQVKELVGDPEAFEAWWSALGDQMGFFEEEPGNAGGEQPQAEAEIPAWAQQLVDSVGELKQGYDAIQQERQESVQRETAQQAEQRVTEEIQQIVTEHSLDDEDKQAVLELAHGYAQAGHEDAIARGFQRFQQIRGKSEGDLVRRKTDQPETPETGGQAATAPTAPRSFRDAKQRAAERLAAP